MWGGRTGWMRRGGRNGARVSREGEGRKGGRKWHGGEGDRKKGVWSGKEEGMEWREEVVSVGSTCVEW